MYLIFIYIYYRVSTISDLYHSEVKTGTGSVIISSKDSENLEKTIVLRHILTKQFILQ